MTKHKTASVPAVTEAASLAARQLAALECEAKAVHASEIEKSERSLRLISSGSGFSALIKHGIWRSKSKGMISPSRRKLYW